MDKRGLVFLFLSVIFVILILGVVVAQENDSDAGGEEESEAGSGGGGELGETGSESDEFEDGEDERDDLRCLACGDSCADADFVAAAECLPPTNGEPICGVENGACVVLGFEGDDEDKVEICHIPPGNEDNANTIEVSESAVEDHLGHGDYVGECDDFDDIDEDEIDDELGDGGSINGIDRFFDGIFQSDINNMRERFAEVRTLIKDGRIEEAKELLEHYRSVADKLEKEVRPEDRDEAVRITRIIRKAIKNLDDRIADEEEFDVISEKAKNVGAAAEIAAKIRELCAELHELGAWDEFERVCKTDDDGPGWQKDFYEGLTDEQREEAEKFGRILSACMRTSGEDCDCAEIPHEGMAAMCFEAAPLARACDLEDDEDACDRLDELEFPDDLPEHLEEVLFRVEEEYGDASYDHHIPGPCRDAGIDGRGRDDRERCFEIMIETEAPPECRDAIKAAGADNERDARRICEEIMFELHAPDECIEAGITNPRDCAEFFGDEFGPGGRRGPNKGPDCGRIENPEQRLRCYDEAERHYDDRYEDRSGPGGGWPGPCREAEAFTRESCERIMRDEGDRRYAETKQEERQCAQRCSSEGKAWDFSNGCRCFEGHENYGEFYDDRDFEDYDKYEDNTARYDCSEMFCGEGHYCDAWRGCVSSGDDDYPDEGQEYHECAPDEFYTCEGGSCYCYKDNSGDFNVEGNPDYDPRYGGDGTSCNEGYESDGQGGCIPFGTGDYGFDDDSSGDDHFQDEFDSSVGEGSGGEFSDEGSDSGGSSSGEGEGSGSFSPGGESDDSGSGGSDSGSGGSDSGSSDSGSSSGGDSGGGDGGITGNAFLEYYN